MKVWVISMKKNNQNLVLKLLQNIKLQLAIFPQLSYPISQLGLFNALEREGEN